MVLDDVLDVLHTDDGHLQHVSLLLDLHVELGVVLAEGAGAGPELGPLSLLTGQRLEVFLRHPETAAAEAEVQREHPHLVPPHLDHGSPEPILSGLEDQELSHAEFGGHRDLLGLRSQVLEVGLGGNNEHLISEVRGLLT